MTFGSIWCTNHDIRNWGHFYHWNHQQTYWGLQSGGHEELAENYYNYRFGMLQHAVEDAEKLYQSTGAFFSDISNYNGYQALEPDTVRNLTVGAQIAMDFYRNFRYTQDIEFLKKKAYPFMKKTAELYEHLLVKSSETYLIQGGSTCYESYWNMKRTMTDICMVKVLFRALVEVSEQLDVDETKRELWHEIAEHMGTLPSYEKDGKRYLSPAINWNDETIRYGEGIYPYNTFGFCQLVGVYPAGLINLNHKDSEEFRAARNTMQEILNDNFQGAKAYHIAGHTAATEMVARLGMENHTMEMIRFFVEKYQIFNNGMCHFKDIKGTYPEKYKTRRIDTKRNTDWHWVHEKQHGDRANLDTDQFLHLYFEGHANIYAGINEMLLQSVEGVIRVFPACEKGAEAAFCLRAEGGFQVISEIRDNHVKYIQIKSFSGNECCVCLPWEGACRILENGLEILVDRVGEIVKFQTEKNHIYLIEPCQYPIDCYYINDFYDIEENLAPKYFRGNVIGKDCEL